MYLPNLLQLYTIAMANLVSAGEQDPFLKNKGIRERLPIDRKSFIAGASRGAGVNGKSKVKMRESETSLA